MIGKLKSNLQAVDYIIQQSTCNFNYCTPQWCTSMFSRSVTSVYYRNNQKLLLKYVMIWLNTHIDLIAESRVEWSISVGKQRCNIPETTDLELLRFPLNHFPVNTKCNLKVIAKYLTSSLLSLYRFWLLIVTY